MSLPAFVMWAVVAGIGFPAAFRFRKRGFIVHVRNRTALALCVAWLCGELIWRMTGENLPITLYFILDYFVLLVIFTKPELRDLSPYRTFADQMKALVKERSKEDVFIACIFPVMWAVYVANIGDFYRWWMLWGLVQLQFYAAGWEAWGLWRAARAEKALDNKPPGLFKLGMAGHG